MDIINIALIGAGRAGRFHLYSLNKTRLFNLKYIVDLDLSKAIELSNDYHVNQESIKVINVGLVTESAGGNTCALA